MNNLKLALRGVTRNKRRTLITAGAIALALTFMIVMNAFVDGSTKQTEDKVIESTGHVQLFATGYYDKMRTFPTDIAIGDLDRTLAEIRGMDGVTDATARITFGGLTVHGNDEIAGLFIGIEPEAAGRIHHFADKVQKGRYLTPGDKDCCVIGYRMAELLHVEVGDTLTVVTQTAYGALTAVDLTVVGVLATLNPMIDEGGVLLRLVDAQRHLELPDAATSIIVNGEDPEKTEELKDALLAALNTGVKTEETRGFSPLPVAPAADEEVPLFTKAPTGGFEEPVEQVEAPTKAGFEGYTWYELNHLIFELLDFKNQITDIIRAIMIILAAAMIANTMLTNVFERTQEIGVLMAMGAKGRQILGIFLGEAATLGAIGSLAGVILGAGVGLILQSVGIDLGDQFTTLINVPLDRVLYAMVRPMMLAHAFGLGVLVSVLAGLYPAAKAARMLPTKALRFI
jgi:putative ABC transport system permease protein